MHLQVSWIPFKAIKGRRLNKAACIALLALALLALAAAAVCAFLDKAELSVVFLIFAAIGGGLALLYGAFWLVWSRRERKAEQTLRETFAREAEPSDPARPVSLTFDLPKAQLTDAALSRLRGIVRWTAVASLVAALLIGIILLATGAAQRPVQLAYLLVFCALIMLPGLLVQGRLYRLYDRTVPERIRLFPGKLTVDRETFPAGEIAEIRISPERSYNGNSPAVFRELLIRTGERSVKYRIDYRSGTAGGSAPFWEDYGRFVDALSDWGAGNGVPVTVAFMD